MKSIHIFVVNGAHHVVSKGGRDHGQLRIRVPESDVTGLLGAQILKEVVNATLKTRIGGAWFWYGETKVFLAGVFVS